MSLTSEKIRNVAIIAHVDHGKTTFVDGLLHQSGTFRENEQIAERVMDSNDIEKERGITILAKCTSVRWNDYKINIIDTPGHADFGGEVERILSMVDGVMLLVDSVEGPMPQTKFVLSKALKLGLKVMVVVNKVDKPEERAAKVLDEIYELFMSLDATDEQIDFPVLYGAGRDGWMTVDKNVKTDNMHVVFDTIIHHVSRPKIYDRQEFSFLSTMLNNDPFVGKMLVGKVYSGIGKVNQNVKSLDIHNNLIENGKITKIFSFEGIKKQSIDSIIAGDICMIAGMQNTSVSDTICDPTIQEAIPSTEIDPPTISIKIGVNTSPFSGKEGTKVTSSLIRERLYKEAESNIAIRIRESEEKDSFTVEGRGELQLAILIENMRREGFELSIGAPDVIYKTNEKGSKTEPIEEVVIDVDEEYMNPVIKEMTTRKGDMKEVSTVVGKTRMIFYTASRMLPGLRNSLLTLTKGTAIINRLFVGYEEYKGDARSYRNGVLISTEQGNAVGYALDMIQERGILFVKPGDVVYTGMIIGEHSKDNDLEVNPIREKKLTNVRASGTDEAISLIPPKEITLETAITYIQSDELIEVTPKSIRLRKLYLDSGMRKRMSKSS